MVVSVIISIAVEEEDWRISESAQLCYIAGNELGGD
jgi:hypothetical protein